MRVLFVMDPLDSLDLRGDSTFMLMRECTARRYAVDWCTPRDLHAREGACIARATPVVTRRAGFEQGEARDVPLADFDLCWMRKDPPFDMHYVFCTYLLDMAPPSTLVLNAPAGLRTRNEKLFAMGFADLTPPSLISCKVQALVDFVRAEPGRAVLKPWDGNGGRGVVVTDARDRNLPALVELLTAQGREYAIAQRFVPGIADGDKRILLVDGDPAGAVLRVPGKGDHRGNLHVGASAMATDLSKRDRQICAALRPVLRKELLVFVGIDVIDGWLTEINVTSPTGIQEVNRLDALAGPARVEVRVMDAAERRLAERRAPGKA